ncbi:Wzz/FepE/Etk N-terminal domain-containing protein [Chungangia koreensis]|uniref:Wzz/FepE/Etk N-terminal domain-containing protein n=1 Tax=Chungangia koreensis TaxID=752657 RepID=A0ABV8X7E1_9LACT
MEETISLQELLQVIRKRIILIITLVVVAICISGVASYFFITQFIKLQHNSPRKNGTADI